MDDGQDLGNRVGRAGVAALPHLTPGARTKLALRLGRLGRLDREQRTLVADLLELIVADLRDNPPTPERAAIIAILTDGLMLLRDGCADVAPQNRNEVTP
jgi:hypothetical protein